VKKWDRLLGRWSEKPRSFGASYFLEMFTASKEGGFLVGKFGADLGGAVDEAVSRGYGAPSQVALDLARELVIRALNHYGAEATVRPAVGPKGIIEVSVSRNGGNRFIAFIPGDGSEVRIEINRGVRANDPDRTWIEGLGLIE